MRLMLAGGAPLSKEVHEFMRVCIGCPLLQGYGLTEVTACATLNSVEEIATEQVGPPNQVCTSCDSVEKSGFYCHSDYT